MSGSKKSRGGTSGAGRGSSRGTQGHGVQARGSLARGGLRVRVKTAKGRTLAQKAWLERQLNDPYVAAAKREGYRSRAAYKLIELDERFHLLKPGMAVVDLGAAPGGWTQVSVARVNAAGAKPGPRGKVLGVDLTAIEPITGAELMQLDFMAGEADKVVAEALGGQTDRGQTDRGQTDRGQAGARRADLVLSDMAAPATGHPQTDHLRIIALCEAAAEFARMVLAPGGAFVAKVLRGGTERTLLDQLKRDFAQVRHAKPPASRADSAEIYVVATGFRGHHE